MLAQAPRPPVATAAPPPARRPQNIPVRPYSQSFNSRPPSANGRGKPAGPRRDAGPRKDAEHEILFQDYFKSVNPQRTYAAQVKKAGNGNHYVVFTEGRRDDATGEVRKTRLFVYSEDFVAFFKMIQQAAYFIKANPVPDEVSRKRKQFWSRKGGKAKTSPAPATAPPSAPKPAASSAPTPAVARPPSPAPPTTKPRP
jgi:hypothetical protein